MNNKIHQAGKFRLIELAATGTIFPGMLLQSAVGGVAAHSTAGGFAEKMFAQEDALQGGTTLGFYINGGYVGYTVGGLNSFGPDMVQIAVEESGSLVLASLLAGHAYTEGMLLISDGAGHLKPTTGSPTQIIASVTALGTIDLTASGAVNTLSQVRVL